MFLKHFSQLCALGLLAAPLALANDIELSPLHAPGAGSGVSFTIGFTAGTHVGKVGALDGKVIVDSSQRVHSAKFSVPIASITTGNVTRDCHLREALGLDYTHSVFPAQHACDSNNSLPSTGPNSVAFPTIDFEFVSFKLANGDSLPALEVGTPVNVLAQGRWTIHGQAHNQAALGATTPVQLTLLDAATQKVRIVSNLEIVLKDHGVVVKPFKLGPISVTVSDRAKINLDFTVAIPADSRR